MKEIKLTDEMYDFLINMSNEMKTQNNRITAFPYIFQVEETYKVPTCNGFGDELLISDDRETELRDEGDMRDHLDCYFPDEFTREDLDEKDFGLVNETDDTRLSNVFFTEKACEGHININRHNYKSPRSYVSHAYRNKEIETLQRFILGLTKDS